MKSILIISNYLPPRNSGAGQRAYNHAIQLSKKGYNVHLISESPNGKKTYLRNSELLKIVKLLIFQLTMMQKWIEA